MLAQRLQQPLSLKDQVIGKGRGREFHFPAKFVICTIQAEVFIFDAGAISGFSEAQERRLGIFFLLAAVLADFNDFSFHGLQLAKALAARVAISIGNKLERVFPNVQKIQDFCMLGVSRFECSM